MHEAVAVVGNEAMVAALGAAGHAAGVEATAEGTLVGVRFADGACLLLGDHGSGTWDWVLEAGGDAELLADGANVRGADVPAVVGRLSLRHGGPSAGQ